MKFSGKDVVSKRNTAMGAAVIVGWELARFGFRKLAHFSERKEVERLQRENTLLRALLDQTPEPVSVAPESTEPTQMVEEKKVKKTGT